MKTLTDKAGNEFEFTHRWYIIEGNHGNHSGHNRKWKILGKYAWKSSAQLQLSQWANESNGTSPRQPDYTPKTANSAYTNGLQPMRIVSPAQLIADFDESGSDLASIASYSIGIKHLNPKED